MSDRLSDELVAEYLNPTFGYDYSDPQLYLLAQEVQDSRRRLAAIRALPDSVRGTTVQTNYDEGYEDAMRQVKALLEAEEAL